MSRQITEQPPDWPIRRVWYPSARAVVLLHRLVMERIGQEPSEPRDFVGLSRALDGAFRPHLGTTPVTYADRAELTVEATKLMVAIALSQAFADGNKRTALLAGDVFLRRHGFRLMTGQVRMAEALQRLVLSQDHNVREARIAELEELIRAGSGPLPRLPITPRNLVDEHRVVLTDEDELAEYRVEQRATSWVKPDQPDTYQTILVAYAQLKERPLPQLRSDERGRSLTLLPLLADPPLSQIPVPNGLIRGAVYEGRLTLGFDCLPLANPGGTDEFGAEVREFPELDNLPPEYRDPAWVLEQAKLMARSADRALRRLQRA